MKKLQCVLKTMTLKITLTYNKFFTQKEQK